MAETNVQPVRLFIAVELPEKTRRALTQLQERLKRACGYCPARWVAADNIHLTLDFLGAVAEERVAGIKQVIAATCASFEPFELSLAEAGAFPNLSRPNVVWVGLDGNLARLAQLQQLLEQGLAPLGFNPENRPFSPHLTLARVRDEASAGDRKRLGEAIAATACDADCIIPVESVSLIKSNLTAAGPVYTVLAVNELGK